jgi:hypothetical protein
MLSMPRKHTIIELSSDSDSEYKTDSDTKDVSDSEAKPDRDRGRPTASEPENDEDFSEAQWTRRAMRLRNAAPGQRNNLIIRNYRQLLSEDIIHLRQLCLWAIEEGANRIDFLKGIFDNNWSSGVPAGPAPTIPRRVAADMMARVGVWRKDCDHPKRLKASDRKVIHQRRKKGADAFLKLTPTRLGLSFDAVDSATSFASLDNIRFDNDEEIEALLAGLIQRYDEREALTHREHNLGQLTHIARTRIRAWYRRADSPQYIPQYGMQVVEPKYKPVRPRAVGQHLYNVMRHWAERVREVLPGPMNPPATFPPRLQTDHRRRQ